MSLQHWHEITNVVKTCHIALCIWDWKVKNEVKSVIAITAEVHSYDIMRNDKNKVDIHTALQCITADFRWIEGLTQK